eukprot:m.103422 g.103422  ORF g.103422 m.103422 type:complete len:341 (-) comp13810_c0_seq2:1881-2903(-)
MESKRQRLSDNICGFVDIQINGWCGIDFSSPKLTKESCELAFDAIRSSGTAYFMPTVITSPVCDYEHVLPILVQVSNSEKYKDHVLGFHLEGPFISPKDGAVGCHRKEHCKAPDSTLLKHLAQLCKGKLKLITIASELENASQLCKDAVDMGIVVSLGHQLATREDIKTLVAAGATMLTHLGNGMPNLVNRHRNSLMVGMAADELVAGIITDGFHLPVDTIKNILRSKGISRVYITSDAAPVAGMEDGVHECFGKKVIVETNEVGSCVKDAVEPCLAGSGASMMQCVNYLSSLNLVSENEMLDLSFYNPLKFVGIDYTDLVSVPCLIEKRNGKWVAKETL